MTKPRLVEKKGHKHSGRGPIFIGGPDRCGKTTMRAFLASHPRIAIPAVGSNMWTYFYGQFGDLSRPDNFERCLDAMLHYKHVAFLKPDPDRIRKEFWEGEPTYAQLFALFLKHFAEREGKPRWGVQTGLIERYADHIFAAHPGVKMIHMLRDPRDRYEASLAAWPSGKGRAGGAAARWLHSARLAKRNQQRYPDNYRILRYETMVSRPESTLTDICEFLNEEYSPSMFMMDGAPEFREKLLKGARINPRETPVSTDYIGLFRNKVPKRDIVFIQSQAKKEMLEFDYSMEAIAFSASDWLRYAFVDWPLNLARMGAWQAVESLQHNFPSRFARRPGSSMTISYSSGWKE